MLDDILSCHRNSRAKYMGTIWLQLRDEVNRPEYLVRSLTTMPSFAYLSAKEMKWSRTIIQLERTTLNLFKNMPGRKLSLISYIKEKNVTNNSGTGYLRFPRHQNHPLHEKKEDRSITAKKYKIQKRFI